MTPLASSWDPSILGAAQDTMIHFLLQTFIFSPQALHRRGTARKQLGSTLGAAQDFENALRLEPGNTSLAKERDAAVVAHLAVAQLQMPSKRVRVAVEAKVCQHVMCDV